MFILSHSALAAVLSVVFFWITNLTAAITVSDVAKSSRTNESATTCPAHRINYITQTLPQQCLATPWTKPSSQTEASTRSESSDANATTSRSTSLVLTRSSTSLSPAAVTASSFPISAAQTDVPPQSVTDSEQDSDADPFSDKGNFLSFEEWKMQMLEKSGQSPDHIGIERKGMDSGQRRRPGDINNALDTLGDDSEIELDFSGFVNADNAPRPLTVKQEEQDARTGAREEDGAKSNNRLERKSKDAGTTCKERFNYASFDCAATVLKTNPESKGSTSVLVENKDSYMLNPCKVKNKFFIVELCNDILIDTVVLANFEFFSSTFRTFRVSVADRYPVKADKWRELGTFEARNTRAIQPFLVENGLIFARYLRFEFLTHYGVEYYCPISLLRVHGKTMMDDFIDFRSNRGDEDAGDDAAELENEEKSEGSERVEVVQEPEMVAEQKMEHIESPISDGQNQPPSAIVDVQVNTTSALNNLTVSNSLPDRKDLSIWLSYSSPLFESHNLVTKSCNSNATFCHMKHSEVVNRPQASSAASNQAPSATSNSSTASSTSELNEPTATPSQPSSIVANTSALLNKTEQMVSSQNSTQSSQPTKAATTQPSPNPRSYPSSTLQHKNTTSTPHPAAKTSNQ